MNSVCRCGHTAKKHQHYSRSTHCALRGCQCPAYRRRTMLERFRTWRNR